MSKPLLTIEVTSEAQFHALWEALAQFVENQGEHVEELEGEHNSDPSEVAKAREKLEHVEAAMHKFDALMTRMAGL